jgi:hypothetical protein
MAAESSLDLKSDPRAMVGMRGNFPSAAERDRVIREYHADTGLVQTMSRLADNVMSQARR